MNIKKDFTHSNWLSFPPLPSDDFLGVAPSTHLNPPTRLDGSLSRPPATLTTTGAATLSPVASPGEDAALSVSSDSVSLPTQVEVRPESGTAALAQKLSEASLDDGEAKAPEEPAAEKSDSLCEVEAPAPTAPEAKGDVAVKAPPTAKEEGPQDLRVFELNSDSGKSTPSNNGKKGRGFNESLGLNFWTASEKRSKVKPQPNQMLSRIEEGFFSVMKKKS